MMLSEKFSEIAYMIWSIYIDMPLSKEMLEEMPYVKILMSVNR